MSRSRDVKVGIFVLSGLLFAALVIFLIGDERRFFNSSVKFRTSFADVQGLKPGAPVRMGGIDIGTVEEVGYTPGSLDPTVHVKLSIVKAEAGRIRKDSVARVSAKGLLGDKMVELTKGSSQETVPPGGDIPGEEPTDLMGIAEGMTAKADTALGNIAKVSENLADEQLHKDLRQSVASMNKLLRDVSEGEGYPRKFLTDKEEAERISRTLQSLDRASSELALTLQDVRAVLGRVKTGPGFAHDVVYGDGPQKEIAQFGAAAGEIAQTLKGVRESDSFAHDVLYGGKGDGAEALSNVTAMTADLRAIVHDMRAGKGTVGALLVDPSIYEDLKGIVGNVGRNDILRALVRYSIKQDERKPEVGVTPPAPASAPAPAPAPATNGDQAKSGQ
ncbi:MlaD family protein [Polyangium aurulentum]|uniref:MlaD family protein n=1 Tax=Polyangium aurulentum TaxID=2567896 RepID=UPI0010AE89F4|nr:MlaD family protein [Polyangium aurulentum]UQA55871.1 MCE family protein [Polyangium aurulentum]